MPYPCPYPTQPCPPCRDEATREELADLRAELERSQATNAELVKQNQKLANSNSGLKGALTKAGKNGKKLTAAEKKAAKMPAFTAYSSV